jgi:hypothetical protein
MTHPTDGELLALLDGELPELEQRQVLRHTAECPGCTERLAVIRQASQATGALLELLSPPEPVLALAEVTHRARRARMRRSGLIAAAVTLLVAATAGATVGRPYVRAVAARIWAAVHPRASVPASPNRPPADNAGVAVVPGLVAEIAFDTSQYSGALRVRLADSVELSIRSDAPVSYRVRPGGIDVHNRGSTASFDVLIPRAAPYVRIRVAGRVVLEKVGPRGVVGATPDSAGRYVLSMRAP